ncbi:MAG TPA: hypothetical protein ENN21_09860 [Spirochaetes bacterium]|nr:hypothetical protein [Spirochaetota bacterium]
MTIRGVLSKNGIDIETGFLNLHSLPMIKRVIAKTRNTAFMRSDFSRYIREVGNPFLIIIDGHIDLGSEGGMPPDPLKLLRTYMISYIILSRGRGFERLRGNFILLNTAQRMPGMERLEQNPPLLLETLLTRDGVVNSFINELMSDIPRYRRLFLLRSLNADLPAGEVVDLTGKIIKSIHERDKSGDTPAGTAAPGSPMNREDFPAARVVYRIDEARVYVDGEILELSAVEDLPGGLAVGEFYVLGHWTSKTLLEVGKKFTGAVVRGIATVKFDPSQEIIVNIGDNCVVDGATASSLAQILLKDLSAYRNIRLRTAESNRKIFENSTGFSMIRHNLVDSNQEP